MRQLTRTETDRVSGGISAGLIADGLVTGWAGPQAVALRLQADLPAVRFPRPIRVPGLIPGPVIGPGPIAVQRHWEC